MRKPYNVLLVNDEMFLLVGYSEQMKNIFTVITAENGLQALQEVSLHDRNFFDAIILDINMPIMDGFKACD